MAASSSREQRSALTTLTRLAVGALSSQWNGLNGLPDMMEQLCGLYGLAAGTLAADWYDTLREDSGARKRFTTEPASMPTIGLYLSLVDKLAQGSPNTALARAQGEVQRVVANSHRDTVTQLSGRDPAAAGWRRVGDGANCGFCRMLIGRGAVYKQSTARFASHGHCNCVAAPAFDEGRTMPTMPYTRPTESQSDATRAADAKRVRKFETAH